MTIEKLSVDALVEAALGSDFKREAEVKPDTDSEKIASTLEQIAVADEDKITLAEFNAADQEKTARHEAIDSFIDTLAQAYGLK